MKFILVSFFLLVSASSFAQKKIINNSDILKYDYLKIELDGVELWDVDDSKIEDTRASFHQRCTEDISERMESHFLLLSDSHDFFNPMDISRENRVVSKFYHKLGEQLICESIITINEDAGFFFELDYSTIFKNRFKGTYHLCQDLIKEIDRSTVRQGVIVRRAYYTYKQKKGKAFFPSCQTLAVRITEKKE